MAWSGDMIQVLVDTRTEKRDIKFVVADEGGMLWTDNNMIPKGASAQGHGRAADRLVLPSPRTPPLVEDYVNYICPVKGADVALQAIDPEVAEQPADLPDPTTIRPSSTSSAR